MESPLLHQQIEIETVENGNLHSLFYMENGIDVEIKCHNKLPGKNMP